MLNNLSGRNLWIQTRFLCCFKELSLCYILLVRFVWSMHIYLSIYLSIYLVSVNLSIYPSIYLSIYFISVNLSIYLSIYLLLCRGVRPLPMSVLDMTLNNLIVCSRNAGALGNVDYVFIAIAPRSTLAQSGSTW